MRKSQLDRRRFLTIIAGTLGWPLAQAAGPSAPAMTTWRGVLMGAEVSILLGGADQPRTAAAVQDCAAAAQRLEGLFSLQRPDSTIAHLNAHGVVADPPADFRALITTAQSLSALTDGAFDATVQPLWRLYSAHFARVGNGAGPSLAAVAAARACVDFRRLSIDDTGIGFTQGGMALTLNGIAQGYITDQIAALLRARGFSQVLINMGEHYALGSHPSGRPWQLAIRDPQQPLSVLKTLPLRDAALATSGGDGLRFDTAGHFHHLFDPTTGASTTRYLSVSVSHPRATLADGLSTAFSAMSISAIRRVVAALPGTQVWLVLPDGGLTTIGQAPPIR